MPDDYLLNVQNLRLHYPVDRRIFARKKTFLRAVDDVSFAIRKGQTLGLVGESGCGKTTVGRALLRLVEPTSGQAWFREREIFQMPKSAFRSLRREMQIIFQDPYGSLNPRMTVNELVGEPLKIHQKMIASERLEKVTSLLDVVGLDSHYLDRYPHEFSGGQRQRIGIARALASNPSFIVCDEPISALDVSIQSQIINLLKQLQNDFGITYLFIAHDLSIVKHISHEIAVMYLGKIVEMCPSEMLFSNPLHPYTQALLSAILEPDPDLQRERIVLEGDLPSAIEMPSGCRFHTRCPYKMDICEKTEPALKDAGEGHFVACHLVD